MIIYKITNKVSGRHYIGKTKNSFNKRKQQHIYDSTRKDFPIYRAVRKYGWDAFEWEIVEHCESLEQLNERETYWINHYDSFKNGYNTNTGGDNCFEISDELRKKRRERMLGENNPMYNVPSPLKGKRFSEDHRNKIKNALLGKPKPESVRGGNHSLAKKVINKTTGEIFDCINDVPKKYPHISRQSVSKCCRGINKTAKGFVFEYL